MATGGDEDSFASDNRLICAICLKESAKYTCPRCNIRYCSSGCYKHEGHGDCSESFYKDCFMDGLKDTHASEADRHKMLEMLRRLEADDAGLSSEGESDDEETAEVDLETRMKGLNLDRDADIMWDRLTKTEKQEFQEMLKDGRLGSLVELWDPWWKLKRKGLVEEVGVSMKLTHPAIKKDIVDFNTLLKNVEPSSQLPFIVASVLYGYAYIARLHNGEHQKEAAQATQDVEQLLSSLSHTSPLSVSEALHGCISCLHNQENDLFVSPQYSVAVIEDVGSILASDHPSTPLTYILAALSDLHRLLNAGRRALQKDLKEAKDRNKASEVARLKDARQKCFASCKKVEFLLSWAAKHGDVMQALMMDVDLEFCALSTELASHHKTQKQLEENWGGKRPRKQTRFIEEVTDSTDR